MNNFIAACAIVAGLFVGFSSGQSMKIHTHNTVETFKLSEIDSVTFALEDVVTVPVTELRIGNNEISGWSEDESGYSRFVTIEQLRLVINGAADIYAPYLIDGFNQELSKGSTGRTCRYFIIACGSADNAASLYVQQTINMAPGTSAGSFPAATAIINVDYVAGCCAFAHFGQYYAEISFDGFNPKSESISTAVSFLEVLKAKIDSLPR